MLKDVAQRSRLCRRHAGELARGVLEAVGDKEREVPIWSTSTLLTMAEVVTAAVQLPSWRPRELRGQP